MLKLPVDVVVRDVVSW